MTESDLLTDTAMVESQYCAELASARNPFEFEQKTKNIIKRLGFSDYAFARVNTFKESDVIFATNPAEQLTIYQEEQLYEHDLVLTYARSHSRPVFLADLYEGYYELLADIELPSRRHDVYDLNKRFGYYDYYCVPAVTCNGQDRILLAVSQQHLSPLEFQRKAAPQRIALQVLCKTIDYVATTKFPDLFQQADESRIIEIGPHALLVLTTLADNDLTLPQVAERLGTSEANVVRHLEAAKRAFGVKTNHAAIKQAVQAGLIAYS